MTFIASVGLGIPEHVFSQEKVKQLVQEIFSMNNQIVEKLFPVFDNALVKERQFVVDENWFKAKHSFEEKNNLYIKHAKEKSLEAIDHCLINKDFLHSDIPYDAIDMVMFVSSTGISTPSLDVHLLNERPFRENIIRMPLWGLGCAGGAMGLSRSFDWIQSNPEKTALVICCELCSLTFQKQDDKMGNLVGTALFGDGVASVLLIGEKSPYYSNIKNDPAQIIRTSSFTKKDTISIMGWDITNEGFEVIFSKRIPKLVNTLWKEHVRSFFKDEKIDFQDIHTLIAHPGGRKVLENMEKALAIPNQKLAYSYDILKNHGNMSSATVFYVLYEWLKNTVRHPSLLCSLGPGFSSELILLDRKES